MSDLWPFGKKRRAFTALVSDNQQRIFRFILKQVGNRADAEELTQEVFLAAYRGYESFRGECLPSTWLAGIAVNIVRNFLRRNSIRRSNTISDEVLEFLPTTGDPMTDLESRRRMESLNAAFFRLPDDSREVLVCVAMEGLSYEQTSVLLELPIGTVRSRLSRARERLKAELEEANLRG